jgi:transcriptional regulator with XRE-family HTH domain
MAVPTVCRVPPRPEDPERARERLVTFGRRLRQLRTWRELSQEALAARAGLSRDYIARLEQGRVSPGLLPLWDLADAFEIRLAELLDEGLPRSWSPTRSRQRPPDR